MTTVAVSGGFDPVHIGHVQLLKAARGLGDRLVVVLNNDHWLKKKKGFIFMDQKEREAVLRAIRYVDDVILSGHPENPPDMSVSAELARLKPDIFANGGDRNETDAQNPQSSLYKDISVCKALGIRMVFNVGGEKTQSSSELVRKVRGGAP